MFKGDSSETTKKPRLSCAECRRLKLKCNRVWPCTSCEKRGVADLCPLDSLTTRSRYRPPPTPLHVLQRISQLQSRVDELEDALADLQATISPDPHPLLHKYTIPYVRKRRKEMDEAKGSGLGLSSNAESGENDESAEIIDALGTLSIAPSGKSTFFGPTAVSEGLSTGKESDPSQKDPQFTFLPVDIAALAESFPFSTLTEAVANAHDRIRCYLPPVHRAESLCNTYFSHASFVAYTVPQDEMFETLFFRLYGRRRSSRPASNPQYLDGTAVQYGWHHVPPDELSVFFSILALGALTDITTEAFSIEAETYYKLSRALLTRQNVLTEPTLASVQTLFLGSYYEGMQSQGNSSRDCWIKMVLACKTAQIVGLRMCKKKRRDILYSLKFPESDRDHSMFGLDSVEGERRRQIFWEVYSMDLIESLAFGRPLSLTFNHADTKMPVDIYATTNAAGEVSESFYSWKYRFCAEVLSVVSDHVLRVKTPSYKSALEADRKLRDFKTTFGRNVRRTDVNANFAAQLQMMLGTRETSILYIHRAFFAHALSTEPINPERSKYGRSVVTAYESARLIVEGMRSFVVSHRKFAARIWFLWNHLLSASFVLGSIVTRAPRSSLGPPCLTLLDHVCGLLKQTSMYGGRAAYMLPIVTRLREKGHNAHMQLHGSPSNTIPSNVQVDDDDELAVIGGKTRVVLSNQQASSSPQRTPPVAMAPPDNLATSNLTTAPTSLDSSPEHMTSEDYYVPLSYPQAVPGPTADMVIWAQDYSHGAMEMGEHTQVPHEVSWVSQGDDPSQQVQYTYNEDAPALQDVGSNEWQRLVRDLGV